MIAHVTITWALANMLHPFLFLFYLESDFSLQELGPLLQFIILSVFFSLPALLLAYLVTYMVKKIPVADAVKLLAWVVIAPLLALLNWIIVALFMGGGFYLFDRDLIEPSMVAVLVVVLFRSHYFLTALVKDREDEARYSEIDLSPDRNENKHP